MLETQKNGILEQHIVRTLLYYDIFNYPLKSSEVYQFLGMNSITEKEIVDALNTLRERKLVFRFEEFYSMQSNVANVQRRVKGNIEAEKYLGLARKKAKLISKFPFVRAVFASGSLSKGYMDENSDLDFFIVTTPKRLWIARTLLVLYKRLFLFNSHRYFCVNYFVDEDHLEIEEKNLFTATELATVIPLYGSIQYGNLHQRNAWLKDFFPNYKSRNISNVPASVFSFRRNILERIINLILPDKLESYFRNLTLARWKRLYQKNYSATDFKVAFKSKSYASKNHDRNFQSKVMDLYEDKVKSIGDSMDWQLDRDAANYSVSKKEYLLNSNTSA